MHTHIQNPQKKIVVDYPIAAIKEKMELIPTYVKCQLIEKDDAFSMYTFAFTEFLSMGSYLVINLTELSETKTEINIEATRKIGSYNESSEIHWANQQIKSILQTLSGLLSGAEMTPLAVKPPKSKAAQTFHVIFGLVSLGIMIWLLIYIISNQ